MRHHSTIRKFGREKNQRKALLCGLARSFILSGKIKTTEARAKELRPFIEKLITRSKTDTLPSRRLVSARLLGDQQTTQKLFTTISMKYKDRNGGYTRITKLPSRIGDGSKMAIIEFI